MMKKEHIANGFQKLVSLLHSKLSMKTTQDFSLDSFSMSCLELMFTLLFASSLDARWTKKDKSKIDNKTIKESKELQFLETRSILELTLKTMTNMKIQKLMLLLTQKNQRNQRLKMLKKKEERMNKSLSMIQQKSHQPKPFKLNQIMTMERRQLE